MVYIEIVDYDPDWPKQFRLHRDRLRAALGQGPSIEHIGSTAVPGLASKPIVDIMVSGLDPVDAAVFAALQQGGYDVVVDEPGHRLYAPAPRDAHVHVWGDARDVERHRLFRDWLRSHPHDRVLYEDVKHRLAQQPWKDRNDYAQAKTAVIERILRRARAQFNGT